MMPKINATNRMISTSLALLLPIFQLLAQVKPVEVEYSQKNNNEYNFSYKNLNNCDYTLKIEFSELRGLECSSSLPFLGSVPAGLGNLFTLKPMLNSQIGPSFQFGYKYQKGRLLNKPPKPFIYLLPFSKNEARKAYYPQNILEMINGKKVDNFYSLSFQMRKGDTIFAARRGMVSELKSTFEAQNDGVWFSSETNFVEIFHQDGTFGRYNRFKKGTLLVEEGQLVEAGQPLGIVTDDVFEGQIVMQFSLTYLSKAKAFDNAVYPFDFVVPTFYTKDNPSGTTLQNGTSYNSDWPESIIVQEMSKRELKKRNAH
jgi:Peptidase family M23